MLTFCFSFKMNLNNKKKILAVMYVGKHWCCFLHKMM